MTSYWINQREYTALHPLPTELHCEDRTNCFFDLPHLTAVVLEGDNSQSFLQGQLSCDITEVTPTTMRQGALCNLQGRVMALMDVICWQNFQCILPRDLADATITSLAKAALFSRVKLSKQHEGFFFGFQLQDDQDWIPFQATLPSAPRAMVSTATYCCYHLGSGRYLFYTTQKNLFDTERSHFAQNNRLRGSLAWHALQLRAHEVSIYPSSRGLFLPHRLGLQLRGYLSFEKGCYKGQEIIARTHYRAKLKHALQPFELTTQEPLSSGKKMVGQGARTEVGELVDFCPIATDRYLISASVLLDHPQHFQWEGSDAVMSLDALP